MTKKKTKKKVAKKKVKKPTKAFIEGRKKGLDEAVAFVTTMEQRYRQWAAVNPSILGGMQDGVKGKLEAVMTAKRGIEKLKLKQD
jgi:hypothetical protein